MASCSIRKLISGSPRVTPTALQQTNYIGIAGLGTDSPYMPKTDCRAGVFGYDRKTTVADIKDGTSTTMMLTESGRVIGCWLQAGPATVRGLDLANKPYIGPGRQFGGLHNGVAVIAMADGSVRVVSESINPKVFEALSTIAGGEQVPPE
jgi:prepilin-type processing-associated H-X9-DG protein